MFVNIFFYWFKWKKIKSTSVSLLKWDFMKVFEMFKLR